MNYYDKYIADAARELVECRKQENLKKMNRAYHKLYWMVQAEKTKENPESYTPID